MKTRLRVLHLEDSDNDAELVQETLLAEGIVCDITRVQTSNDFVAALEQRELDMIFSDYSLPAFDGVSALKIAHQKRPTVPFIFVSGTLGEELAIETLKSGATDYVLKHRLSRLVPSVRRALQEVEEQTKRDRAERRLAVQYATASALAESISLEEASPKILKAICENLEWDFSALWKVDQRANRLRCIDLWHIPSLEVPEFEAVCRKSTFAPEIGLPGRVWSASKPFWIADVTLDANCPRARLAAAAGLHGALGFPILVGSHATGVIEFFSREIRSLDLDKDQVDMLTAIGSQSGQFIERKNLEEQFRQAQKMEAVGTLAGGIAHDFNNLMTAVLGYSDLLLSEPTMSDPIRQDLEEIKKAAESAAALTRQLLIFSRKQVVARSVVDLNAVMTSMDKMLRRVIREDIDLVTIPDPALGLVKVDQGQIEQVIVNLVVNARDAMPEGGRLTIETRNVELDERYAREHAGVQAGPYVMLAVSDTGQGMDSETQNRIFEPFFTTKEKGKGTGLGLATVHGIVEQSGGNIWVDSEPGQGTTFKIYLPRVTEVPEAAKAAEVSAESLHGSETILIVEDEQAVRVLARRVLEASGYRVLEASNGQEALLLSAQYSHTIHLLLTDMILGDINGERLAHELKAKRPGMGVLYMTGYGDNAMVRAGAPGTAVSFLQKPFTPEKLRQKIRDVLGRGEPLDF